MQNSKIQWTDATFNIVWGCMKVSPGCASCYAETLAKRYGYHIWGPAKTTERRVMSANYWQQPIRWNAAAERRGERMRVFCGSMSDVFEDHPTNERERAKLWPLIESIPWLDWLLLTKRPENMTRMAPAAWAGGWPSNIIAMTSVEDQKRADERIPELLKVPAARRGLNCEPLLGPIELWRFDEEDQALRGPGIIRSGGMTPSTPDSLPEGYDDSYPGIDWVIAGGESGHGARPMHPAWARSLRDQCQLAGVSFFMKQWGEYEPYEEDAQPPFWNDQHGRMYDGHGLDLLDPETGDVGMGWHEDSIHSPYAFRRVGKARAGRLLDGRTWDQFPEIGEAVKQ